MKRVVEYRENDITFRLVLEHTKCSICGPSGVGKTLLFRTLSEAIDCDWHKHYFYYDYTNMKSLNAEVLSNKDNIVVLDNVDLFIDELKALLENSKATVIICVKSMYDFKGMGFVRYTIKHTSELVQMELKM